MKWWPFGKKEEAKEVENEFQSQLAEALLRKDDLKAAAESIRIERQQRDLRKAKATG